MAKKGGLGNGLDALFGEAYIPPEKQDDGTMTVQIERVEPREDQPRRVFDSEALAELRESIGKYGLIQPITVRPIDGGHYQIIAGERRWRAAREAGLKEIPVRILRVDDRRAAELALVENLQREDLNPVEEAEGYQKLMQDYGLTQEETAEAVGKSRSAVANALRLLNLPEVILKQLEKGSLSAGHARALLAIHGPELRTKAAETVIEKNLSVRQTEQLAARLNRAPRETIRKEETISVDYIREAERELENALGRKVRLVDGKNRGHIEIEFYGTEDREKLLNNLRLFSTLRNTK